MEHTERYAKGVVMAVEPLTPSRRRELTRRTLLEAAAVVFAREGFHGASLDEVAAAAGFTKGAVYSNFKSKEDLLMALLDEHMDQNIAAAQAARQADAAEGDDELANIRNVMSYPGMWDREWQLLYLEFVLYAARNPTAGAQLAKSIRRSHDIAVGMIREEHERRGIRPSIPLEELATISLSVFEGLTLTNVIEPSLITTETVDAALRFLTAAMMAPETGTEVE
jgi:AcrR family transcriptional regulator